MSGYWELGGVDEAPGITAATKNSAIRVALGLVVGPKKTQLTFIPAPTFGYAYAPLKISVPVSAALALANLAVLSLSGPNTTSLSPTADSGEQVKAAASVPGSPDKAEVAAVLRANSLAGQSLVVAAELRPAALVSVRDAAELPAFEDGTLLGLSGCPLGTDLDRFMLLAAAGTHMPDCSDNSSPLPWRAHTLVSAASHLSTGTPATSLAAAQQAHAAPQAVITLK
ncbi:hypothetical protein HaLaN_28185, partial [Haematococcus lacustris]